MSQQSSIDRAFVTPIDPTPEVKDQEDLTPSSVEEENEPRSLEEALVG